LRGDDDTARNVYLYAWRAYRLHRVAERQGYSTVEFALRERLGYEGKDREPMLAQLLDEAVGKAINEGFRTFTICVGPTRRRGKH
jgi:hypothetical protein